MSTNAVTSPSISGRTLRPYTSLPIDGRRVFIRVDFNTPYDNGAVADDNRIRAALPTIRHVVNNGGRAILASHLGRPKGNDAKYSLAPAGERLAELLGDEVVLTDSCIGDGARKVVADLHAGKVALLENLRYQPGETENSADFAKALASFCDVYINDAFGVCHRAHASMSALPKLVRERGAGELVLAEVKALETLRSQPPQPFAVVLGGAKVSDKLELIETLLERAKLIMIGGAMANTFLAAQGHSVGKSLFEPDRVALARTLIQNAERRDVRLVLPRDVVVADSPDAAQGTIVSVDQIPAGSMALDIGPRTQALFADELADMRSVFWNGPMGLFERPAFQTGSFAMARALAELRGAYTVVGGGDSVAAVHKAGCEDRYSHVSTGGGASLKYLEGKTMPGLEPLYV